MRESTVEKHLVKRVAAAGGIAYKFTSPARRSVPDRLSLLPVPPEHREIVAKYVQFEECKAPGKKPTAGQLREHARLRALGFRVEVIDSIDGADRFVEGLV